MPLMTIQVKNSAPTRAIEPPPERSWKLWLRLAALALTVSTVPYWHILADKVTVASGKVPAGRFDGSQSIDSWSRNLKERLSKMLQVEARPAVQTTIVKDEMVNQYMFDATPLHMRRLTVTIPSRSGNNIVGYFFFPTESVPGNHEKLPCVVCVPGHGQGMDYACGIDCDGLLHKRWDGTPHDFALFFVKRGYAVFCYEQLGIGHRSTTGNIQKLENLECLGADAQARYSGRNMIGLRVDDAMRVIDFVTSRSEIDANKLSMMGISAGGTTTLFTSALDERVKCAIVASAFSSYNDSIFHKVECLCNYAPGLPAIASSGDVAGLVAPRFLAIEAGTLDDRFPASSAPAEAAVAGKVFAARGVPDNIMLDVEEHGHRMFVGLKSEKFLRAKLDLSKRLKLQGQVGSGNPFPTTRN